VGVVVGRRAGASCVRCAGVGVLAGFVRASCGRRSAGVVRAEKCGRRAGVIIWLLSLRFKASLEFTYGLFGVEGRRFLEEKAKSGFQGC
jgi:hypothetical protein